MNIDKIAKELSEEFGVDVGVAKFEFEELCNTLKVSTPSHRDIAYVKQLRHEFLNRVVNYDNDGSGWTMKVDDIYYNRNGLVFEGSGIDWTANHLDGIKGMIIMKNMKRNVDESMVGELEVYNGVDVEGMINDMKEMIIDEARILMDD